MHSALQNTTSGQYDMFSIFQKRVYHFFVEHAFIILQVPQTSSSGKFSQYPAHLIPSLIFWSSYSLFCMFIVFQKNNCITFIVAQLFISLYQSVFSAVCAVLMHIMQCLPSSKVMNSTVASLDLLSFIIIGVARQQALSKTLQKCSVLLSTGWFCPHIADLAYSFLKERGILGNQRGIHAQESFASAVCMNLWKSKNVLCVQSPSQASCI